MTQRDIKIAFKKLKGVVEKEDFMKHNGVKFTYNSKNKVVIFTDDGVMELNLKQGGIKR